MIKKVLGKGLSSLIPDNYATLSDSTQAQTEKEKNIQGFEIISITNIAKNPEQPREEFSPEATEELAESIREKGILQPVIVRRRSEQEKSTGGGQPYELVCGERRLKAALLSGLEKIPAIVKDIARGELLEWALVENIQREDLNPLEEAKAYERLINDHRLSQEEVAKRIGKNRATIANAVRLLRLPLEVLEYLKEGRLTSGHARAILGLFTQDQQTWLARRIAKENLSVRQVEELVARSAKKRRARAARHMTPEVLDLETRLSRLFGVPVRVYSSKSSKQGRIVIHYFSLDELDRILSQVKLVPT